MELNKKNQFESLINKKKGKLLSKFIGTHEKVSICCDNEHIWEGYPYHIMMGTWCPYCNNPRDKSYLYDQLKNFIESKGGILLSEQYIHSKKKVNVKCSKGHEWNATPSHLKSGSWCPYCNKRSRDKEYLLNNIKKLIQSKGGIFISGDYQTLDKSKIKIRCINNHIWETSAKSIKIGNWCPHCSSRVKDKAHHFNKIKEIVESKGGSVLTEEYTTSRTKITIRCKYNHEWEVKPYLIKRGTWCPVCHHSYHKNGFNEYEIESIISHHGGKIIKTIKKRKDTLIIIKCINGHEWQANPDKIKKGYRCPICDNKKNKNPV